MTKPANMPARKLARQIAAQSEYAGMRAKYVLEGGHTDGDSNSRIAAARQVKTKKYRAR